MDRSAGRGDRPICPPSCGRWIKEAVTTEEPSILLDLRCQGYHTSVEKIGNPQTQPFSSSCARMQLFSPETHAIHSSSTPIKTSHIRPRK